MLHRCIGHKVYSISKQVAVYSLENMLIDWLIGENNVSLKKNIFRFLFLRSNPDITGCFCKDGIRWWHAASGHLQGNELRHDWRQVHLKQQPWVRPWSSIPLVARFLLTADATFLFPNEVRSTNRPIAAGKCKRAWPGRSPLCRAASSTRPTGGYLSTRRKVTQWGWSDSTVSSRERRTSARPSCPAVVPRTRENLRTWVPGGWTCMVADTRWHQFLWNSFGL